MFPSFVTVDFLKLYYCFNRSFIQITIFYQLLGISTPRGSTYDPKSGYRSRLPNPRKISTVVFQSQGNGTEDNRHTHMLMQFGQLIDHELTSTFKSGKVI